MKKDLSPSILNKLFLGLKNANGLFKEFTIADEMWNHPMNLVKTIEEKIADNEDLVYDIIAKEKAEKNQVEPHFNAIPQYQTILAELYCLLYYKYSEDPQFVLYVLEPLKENMGIYAKEWYKGITDSLDNILKKEKERAERMEEFRKKNAKPLFEIPVYKDHAERDQLFLEFNKESLFRAVAPIVRSNCNNQGEVYDEVLLWLIAKKFVKELHTLPYPETHIDNIKYKIIHFYNGNHFFSLVAFSMLTIIFSIPDNKYYDKFVSDIIDVINSSQFYVPKLLKWYSLKNIPAVLKELNVINDYDYLEGTELNSSANNEIDAITSTYESKLEEQTKAHEEEVKKLMEKIETLEDANEKLLEKSGTYEAQINELKEQLENLQAIPVDNKNSEIPIDQKVRMEVVCRFYDLIECAYLKTKKQTKAAELMAIITGLDHTTCNSYLSNRRNGKPVSKDYHQKEFDRIYQLYEELEIKAD